MGTQTKPERIPQWIEMPSLWNIKPDFKLGKRRLKRRGHIVVEKPQTILKYYEIVRPENQPDDFTAGRASEFVRIQIEKGRIDPELGLGFAIVSKNFLNVALWNRRRIFFSLEIRRCRSILFMGDEDS